MHILVHYRFPMRNPMPLSGKTATPIIRFGVTERSNRLINYALWSYYVLGIILAGFYGTWWIGIGLGAVWLIIYYAFKQAKANDCFYQYVLSIILGLFMAQFIYQMHGMLEMHFFAFVGSALLISYQNWRLQLPLVIFVLLHHALLFSIQTAGNPGIYFISHNHFELSTFIFHVLLTLVIYFICGLCAYQLKRYQLLENARSKEMSDMQETARLNIILQKNAEAMQERSIILESIADAFFAVDKNWRVTYWNKSAEKVLMKTRAEMLNNNLWTVFSNSLGSKSYQEYHRAIQHNTPVHFEDYFEPLHSWYEISAYPSGSGLSVYFKDISERKQLDTILQESEQRYSDVFHLSPLPMWVVDLCSRKFIDVNEATILQYGYSREEFLTMSLEDIRPPGEFPSMEDALLQLQTENSAGERWQMVHQKKNAELMTMEIQLAPFQFKGKRTNIAVATDITQQLLYIKAIEQQNEKLTEISWMQSHVLRAPLARIMGLVPLLTDPTSTKEEQEDIGKYLLHSADELDHIIRTINETTGVVAIK
jgi:PAS domain S-box-containing protein